MMRQRMTRMALKTVISIALMVALVVLVAAVFSDHSYIPPCTPIEGSDSDPCEISFTPDPHTGRYYWGEEPVPMRFYMVTEDNDTAHLVVRATTKPGSLRCENRLTERNHGLSIVFDQKMTSGIGNIMCYVDLRINSYIVGEGPATLTAVIAGLRYWDPLMSAENVEAERLRVESALLGIGAHLSLDWIPENGIEGMEMMMFLGPAYDASVETWHIYDAWDIAHQDHNTIKAIHPNRDYWWHTHPEFRYTLELTLAEFTRQAQAVHASRLVEFSGRIGPEEDDLPLITNANNLHEWHIITENIRHPEGSPDYPPPPRAPKPATYTVTASEADMTASWAATTGVAKYKLEYTSGVSDTWSVASDSITANSYTITLPCGGSYSFRLSAAGNGRAFHRAWSHASAPVDVATACMTPTFVWSQRSALVGVPNTTWTTPIFEPKSYAFSVMENIAGAEVGHLVAADPNGDTLTYSLTAGNDAGAFTIGSSTGAITTTRALDYETASSHTLTVTASDGLNSNTATVTVRVQDSNDAPVFEQGTYSFSVSESAFPWTKIGVVTATDQDVNHTVGSNVFYSITSENPASMFGIDGSSGMILLLGPLDFETTPSYTLTVVIRDPRGAVTTTTVFIHEPDVAD